MTFFRTVSRLHQGHFTTIQGPYATLAFLLCPGGLGYKARPFKTLDF